MQVTSASSCNDERFDGVVLVTDSTEKLTGDLTVLKAAIDEYAKFDAACGEEIVILQCPKLISQRLVFSPTGPLNWDYDDIRLFSDAACAGVKRALKAGVTKPLLVCPPDSLYANATMVATLGALHATYVPLEVQEALSTKSTKVDLFGIWTSPSDNSGRLIEVVSALEAGRALCRDIGGSDPERMTPLRVYDYVNKMFINSNVKVSVITDPAVFEKEFPCLAAVNRCANVVNRHRGHLIELEYIGEGPTNTTLFLVGKGITYDTGGADIKAGGGMAGMHRDKCGAAAVAGFFKVLAELKPKNMKVVGAMAMVRNSVGADCYVADEIILSRAGKRIRVGNTDAEGRMVMADVLCMMKERALTAVNPQLFTIATLTGHAVRAMGPNYSIILDNGPARKTQTAQSVQKAGDHIGDPFEVSTIRREDFEFHKGKSEYEDVLQANNLPSSSTPRGHQAPAAFLIMASGLDAHGRDSAKPLPYSHLDIAGSSGPFPGIPTGAPIAALAGHYLLGQIVRD
uniref:putative aminopeptidase W07G4.4 n=1 Tax=Myxine glutinosa TaxID=7769 RepID=UPI00358F6852